jgi:hypothetical protein
MVSLLSYEFGALYLLYVFYALESDPPSHIEHAGVNRFV